MQRCFKTNHSSSFHTSTYFSSICIAIRNDEQKDQMTSFKLTTVVLVGTQTIVLISNRIMVRRRVDRLGLQHYTGSS